MPDAVILEKCPAARGVGHSALFSRGEADRLALVTALKPEQDVQHQARHGTTAPGCRSRCSFAGTIGADAYPRWEYFPRNVRPPTG